MPALAGKHALVTGGGSGIGAAIARGLAGEGARLSLAGRRREPLEAVAADLPEATAIQTDVTDEASVTDALRAAEDAFGPVDILIANAGAAKSASFQKTALADWQAALSVNLTGAFLCAKAAMPAMIGRGWGRMIFIASTAGLKGYPFVAAYCAAKHGLVGMTRALALELAPTGVTANALCPGYTETPLLDDAVAKITDETGRGPEEARKLLLRDNPQGRFIQPEEVAAAALWLCRPGSESVNGQAIALNGGAP